MTLAAGVVTALAVASPARAQAPSVEGEAAKDGHAIALGATVGEPTRLSVRYRLPQLPVAFELGVGSQVFDGRGLHVDANVSFEQEAGPVILSIGAGYRYLDHRFAPSSLDEIGSDVHQGIQGVLAASWRPSELPLDLFGELVPGYDFSQSESCTFASGTNTLCPHQAESRDYFHFGVGARYWFAW